MEALNQFLSGALVLACMAVGLLFLRFWRRTGDRLFAILGVAFWLLALERTVLAFVPSDREGRHLIFVVRLVAFILISIGILDKNRARRPPRRARSATPPPGG